MQKNYNTVSARDILISCANKLPENLLIDAINQQGRFSINFLLRLDTDQLACLNKEIAKKNKKQVFLEFSTVQENSTACPVELKDFDHFDWSKVCQIKMSGDTSPYLHSRHSEPYHYISVVFVLKD